MDWIMIGLGAGAGSVLRYEIGRRIALKNCSHKIAGTFAINLTGAFLLGLVISFSMNHFWWNLLVDGFLGGFTTFSTLMVEGVQLIRSDKRTNALAYFSGTMILGIVGFLLGGVAGGMILPR